MVCANISRRHAKSGEVIIRQGDQGDFFYVVESGKLDVHINERIGHEQTADEYEDLGEKVADCTPGMFFGELALMCAIPNDRTRAYAHPYTRTQQGLVHSAHALLGKHIGHCHYLYVCVLRFRRYMCPRAASVVASEDCLLWRLDQNVFKGLLMRGVRMDPLAKLAALQ